MSAADDLDRRTRAAMARRDGRAAAALVGEMTASHPDFAPGWLTASIFRLDVGQARAALEACRTGIRLAPEDGALRVQLVRCLTSIGARSEALAAADAAEALIARLPARSGPGNAPSPALRHELGNALSLLGAYERALELMRAAAAQAPAGPALNYNMAGVLRFLGRFEEAEALLDKVVAAAPGDFEAQGARSQLRTQTADRNHVAELERLLERPPAAWAGEVQLRYALAKEYEDLGRHDEAFDQFARGAAVRRRHLDYDVAGDVAAMTAIARTFDRAWLERPAEGAASEAPIFVLGLPRSGTTLVERILSSHPKVRSLGELNDFPAAVTALGRGAGKEALVAIAARAEPKALGEAYLARVADQAVGVERFIDKLPMNYLYAGLIAKALPGARLVLVERDPMASGHAMFKTLFNQGYPFSYDLDDLGRYIAGYLKLIAHWKAVLGERLITVGYETLVRDPAAETRRLIERCGLEWDEACLSPHRNPAPSSTQSAVQVRRPIYTDSAERWRRHKARLAPLARRLDQR